MATTKFSKIKIGEYFRFVGKSKVYTYDGKTRMYDGNNKFKGWGFLYTPHDDVWGGSLETMTDRDIEIGFDY